MKRVTRMLPALFALVVATACAAETAPVPQARPTAAPQGQAAMAPAAATTTPSPTPTATTTAKIKLGIADITPMGEKTEKVGVGFPIIVTFDRDVRTRDRATVEALLQVESDKPNEGAWRWVSARKIIYRTKAYWKPYQKVLFTARLSELPGNTGGKNVSRRFAVGAQNISHVDTRKHVMKVYRNGKLAKKIPISAGRGGLVRGGVDVYLTTSGTHLTMGKKAVETMTSSWMGVTDPKDPRYYKEEIPWAVRISDSGEYVHQSAGYYQYLGRSNQSHGCVRATPEGAKWFYTIAQRGDVVKITGTKRKLQWNNGWSYWQLSYSQWKKGSALK
ncbi:Putative L,D-transpeptidase LppS precursor [Nonomuraea coxensis DSM 45129]|uniref:L,D-transpeptidase LppS n=1 Tax=Nonomuraea coxensis DSM 45129 TaxID=1122611 RepID=A0ABX8TT94_9ACTN|nr:L,D-transpeptidase [Nonomuraea coxensis]QYC38598.1 Putative L,D-transpeptidase LppS precursor [Nonomuraea coxensis DSM 45129]